jgi:hypothetical protein
LNFYPTTNDDDVTINAFAVQVNEFNENQVQAFIVMIEGTIGQGLGRMARIGRNGIECKYCGFAGFMS